MLQNVDCVLRSERQLVRVGQLDHGIGCRLREVPIQHSADGQGFLEVAASFVMLLQLLGRVGQQDKLTHDLLIVHAAFQALELLLEALLVQVERGLVIVLMLGDDAEVQINLSDYGFVDFIGCLVDFVDQSQALLEVVFRSVQVANLQIAVAKLVADVDEEDRLVKDYFRLDLPLDALELLDGFTGPVTIHEAFGQARPSLDVVINAELQGRAVQLAHQVRLLRRQSLLLQVVLLPASGLEVPIVIEVADLVESGDAFVELGGEQEALGFEREYVQAIAGKAAFDALLGADPLKHVSHHVVLVAVRAAKFQVPEHALILGLLEVGE